MDPRTCEIQSFPNQYVLVEVIVVIVVVVIVEVIVVPGTDGAIEGFGSGIVGGECNGRGDL